MSPERHITTANLPQLPTRTTAVARRSHNAEAETKSPEINTSYLVRISWNSIEFFYFEVHILWWRSLYMQFVFEKCMSMCVLFYLKYLRWNWGTWILAINIFDVDKEYLFLFCYHHCKTNCVSFFVFFSNIIFLHQLKPLIGKYNWYIFDIFASMQWATP